MLRLVSARSPTDKGVAWVLLCNDVKPRVCGSSVRLVVMTWTPCQYSVVRCVAGEWQCSSTVKWCLGLFSVSVREGRSRLDKNSDRLLFVDPRLCIRRTLLRKTL